MPSPPLASAARPAQSKGLLVPYYSYLDPSSPHFVYTSSQRQAKLQLSFAPEAICGPQHYCAAEHDAAVDCRVGYETRYYVHDSDLL